jgi:hypothetical protein
VAGLLAERVMILRGLWRHLETRSLPAQPPDHAGERDKRGRPDATRQPKSHAANLRQFTKIENTSDLVTVTWRTLRYPDDLARQPAAGKGR